MQPFGPRTSTMGTTYTADQVLAFVTANTAQHWYRFERISYSGGYLGEITPLAKKYSARITYDSTQAVSRQLRMQVRADTQVAVTNDLIRTHYMMTTPDKGALDFVVGTFVVAQAQPTTRKTETWIDIQGYDVLQLLADAGFPYSYAAPANETLISILDTIISGAHMPGLDTSGLMWLNIPPASQTLPTAIPWTAGTSRLQACNDVLAAFGYNPLWADEWGNLCSEPIADSNAVTAQYLFDATITQLRPLVASNEIDAQPDLSQTFNQFVVEGEDPNRNAISLYYENVSPDSPVSTVNWRPKMAPPIRASTVINTTTAMALARQYAQLYSSQYKPFIVKTLAWPFSQNLDWYNLQYVNRDEGIVQVLTREIKWEMDCSTGGLTTHTLQLMLPT